MEPTYLIIAAIIIALPFVLSRLFSGTARDTKTVLGASSATPQKKPPPADKGMLTEQIKNLLDQGKKIEAIKLAREKTGFPLEAAKDMVEMIEKAGSAPAPAAVKASPQGAAPTPPQKLSVVSVLKLVREIGPEVRGLAKAGKKIEAIQLIRDRTGLGLKEAKEIVDKLG